MSAFITAKRGHHFVSGLLDENSVIIDLGANRGNFSNELVSEYGCLCYAIEAVPRLFDTIPHHPRIRKFNLAISEKNSPISFSVSSQEESGSVSKLPSDMVAETISVNGVTLGSFIVSQRIDTVDLLKIDIEGAETGLLKTIDDATLSRIKQITVEFHDFLPYFDQKEDIRIIKHRLDNLGFECIRYSMRYHADVLFINRTLSGLDPSPVFVPVLMRELGISPRGVSEGGA
jgi:FkbM family methyltransferase